jgi:hypothetical protein
MDDTPLESQNLPPNLRALARLVTVLTVVMIAGIVIVVGLLALKLGGGPAVQVPAGIALPAGATAEAFTQGKGWYAVVTTDRRILIFDSATGALTQTVEITVN